MAKYTTEEIYRNACTRYEIVKGVVHEMTEIINNASPESLREESAMTAVDLIIQATLLNVAVTDGQFTEIEKQFIDVLTEYGDVLAFVNNEIKKSTDNWREITWNDIDDLEDEVKKKLGAIVASIVDPYAESFVNVFSALDKLVTERDYLKILRESIEGIIISLSLIDGDNIDSQRVGAESYVGFSVLEILLVKKWEEKLNNGN